MSDAGSLAFKIYWHQLSQGPFGDANLDGVVTIADVSVWLGLAFQLPGATFLSMILNEPDWATYWGMDGTLTGGWSIFWSCVGWFIVAGWMHSIAEKWQNFRSEQNRERGEP